MFSLADSSTLLYLPSSFLVALSILCVSERKLRMLKRFTDSVLQGSQAGRGLALSFLLEMLDTALFMILLIRLEHAGL